MTSNTTEKITPQSSILRETTLEEPFLRIQPPQGWLSLQLRELWQYREMLYFLTWRDIKVRYKQTVIGASWAIIQPLMTMVVFSLIFGGLAKIPSDGIPYPIFSFTALVPWGLFSSALGRASASVVGAGNLIKKVYFPRLIIPISSVLAGFVDFAISLVILLLMMVLFGITPTWRIVFLPLFILFAIVTALAAGLWLAAMNAQFRDIGYIVPFLIQIWLYLTPVIYPTSMIQNETLRTLSALNPLSGVIEGFRWALLGTDTVIGPLTFVSVAISILLFITGALYFRRMEESFADII
jgi:lipopolysaccharide transport system permease protein